MTRQYIPKCGFIIESLTAFVALLFSPTLLAESTSLFEPPIPVLAGGAYLDTGDVRSKSLDSQWKRASHLGWRDARGYASPYVTDFDGDGIRDLVVGGFSGQFRVYRNIGTNQTPEFDGFEWIRARSHVAALGNSCCMAVTPRFFDIDGDGIADLTAGSYLPGAVYWFRGTGNAKFEQRAMLTDWEGIPVFTDSDLENSISLLGAKPTWVDWNDDGDIDLIVGNLAGKLVGRLGGGAATGFATPIPSQPVFSRFTHSREDLSQLEFLAPGSLDRAGREIRHVVPSIADWDSDGLWDIVFGSESGAVYWMKNLGTTGAPEFAKPELLISPGYAAVQILEFDEVPARGTHSEVHVVDYNDDGKLDIILGDFSRSIRLRRDISAQEKRTIVESINSIFEQVGYFPDEGEKPSSFHGFTKNPEMWKSLVNSYQGLSSGDLVVPPENRPESDSWLANVRFHGLVWVFLQK